MNLYFNVLFIIVIVWNLCLREFRAKIGVSDSNLSSDVLTLFCEYGRGKIK